MNLEIPLIEPTRYVSELTGQPFCIFPAGSMLSWRTFDTLLNPSNPGLKPVETLDIWHAAIDSEGIVWMGNVPRDEDMTDAIINIGKNPCIVDALQLGVYINNSRQVYRFSVNFAISHTTEEVAFRVLDMLPHEAIAHKIQIHGFNSQKNLGEERIAIREKGNLRDFIDRPNVLRVEDTCDGKCTVVQRIADYPQELTPHYRNQHPHLRQLNIHEWQELLYHRIG